MKRIIREILTLLWKVLRLVLWKWLRPRIVRFVFVGLAVLAAVVFVVMSLANC